MNNHILIPGFFLFFIVSCTKKKVPDSSLVLGLDYYPTASGKFVVYDTDSLIYTELPRDTVRYSYRIKEKLADDFTDNEGQKAIRLERYIKKFNSLKPYDSIPWSLKEVWLVNANDRHVQVVEGNLRFTKLIFPVQEKATWNGNAHNTLGESEYSYEYIDREETVGGNRLANVLMVKQAQYRTLISYKGYFEKYAKGVGLVYREMNDLLSNTIIKNIPVENRIESGIIYKQTLVTYGYE